MTKQRSDVPSRTTGGRYFRLLGYSLERISDRASRIGEVAEVIIESSQYLDSGGKLYDFRNYIEQGIRTGALNINAELVPRPNIQTFPKHEIKERKLESLWMADALAHAGWRALEPRGIRDQREPTLLREIATHLWGWNQPDGVGLFDNGLVLRPRWAQMEWLFEDYWRKILH
jgi:hypothetical protein